MIWTVDNEISSKAQKETAPCGTASEDETEIQLSIAKLVHDCVKFGLELVAFASN